MAGMYTETSRLYPDAIHKDTLQMGLEYQDFVMLTLQKRGIVLQPFQSRKYQFDVGESLQGWEIKLDNPFTKTGRLSIEIAEKSRRDVLAWTPSGIYRDDNSWIYIQGNYDYFFWFQKNILILLHKSGRYEPDDESHGTIRKFYLPLKDAEKYGIKFIP